MWKQGTTTLIKIDHTSQSYQNIHPVISQCYMYLFTN